MPPCCGIITGSSRALVEYFERPRTSNSFRRSYCLPGRTIHNYFCLVPPISARCRNTLQAFVDDCRDRHTYTKKYLPQYFAVWCCCTYAIPAIIRRLLGSRMSVGASRRVLWSPTSIPYTADFSCEMEGHIRTKRYHTHVSVFAFRWRGRL